MTAIETLARFVTETKLADMPTEVVARGRLILADCVGCIIAGNAAPEMRRLRAQPAEGRPEATVLGTRSAIPRARAAYLNGTAGTWHDLDEGNLSTKTHAAIQLVPAALAECEAEGHSGARLLEAVVLAYEASARLWRATEVRHAVHPHGTYGPMAAVLGLAKLRGLDAGRTAEAASIALTLGIASSRAALNDGATVRNVYTGHSGRAAFEALALLEAGFSGESDAAASILGKIYGSAFDPDKAVADLGGMWWILRNYFKRFAAGRYSHGALDLTEELYRAHPTLAPESIARIDVATFFWGASMSQQSVRSAFGSRFSIPVAMARRIVHGQMPLTDDGERAFRDPVVADLAQRIFVVEDEVATAGYPNRQPTRVTVTMTDGRKVELASERILGENDYPLSSAQLCAKFGELARGGLGKATDAVWLDIARIDAIDDVRALVGGWRVAANEV